MTTLFLWCLASVIIFGGFAFMIHEDRRIMRLREQCRAMNEEGERKFQETGDPRHLTDRRVM